MCSISLEVITNECFFQYDCKYKYLYCIVQEICVETWQLSVKLVFFEASKKWSGGLAVEASPPDQMIHKLLDYCLFSFLINW